MVVLYLAIAGAVVSGCALVCTLIRRWHRQTFTVLSEAAARASCRPLSSTVCRVPPISQAPTDERIESEKTRYVRLE